ncbi:MAG: DUF6175 family protein [Bacteroidales bacterium]|jgi:hypothetical protein|nr:DUF6175 family protein [Bacteroidales bacterium]
MQKIKIIAVILMCLVTSVTLGQNSATKSDEVKTIQPKIMVIPYAKQGEDYRTLIEDDFIKRIAITKIKEAFDRRDFTTVDFIARLKAANSNAMFTSDNQTDFKTQLIQGSGADVYVEVEIMPEQYTSGNSIKLILTAYEISTGNSLANKTGESRRLYTEDWGKLVVQAIEGLEGKPGCIEDLLVDMQAKFTDIHENGKSIVIDISFDQNSQYNMSSEVGEDGLPLSDQIEIWLGENAFKGNYHLQASTDVKVIYDDVRIPLRDQSTGQNYTLAKFWIEMFKFFKKSGISASRSINGNTLYITIK